MRATSEAKADLSNVDTRTPVSFDTAGPDHALWPMNFSPVVNVPYVDESESNALVFAFNDISAALSDRYFWPRRIADFVGPAAISCFNNHGDAPLAFNFCSTSVNPAMSTSKGRQAPVPYPL